MPAAFWRKHRPCRSRRRPARLALHGGRRLAASDQGDLRSLAQQFSPDSARRSRLEQYPRRQGLVPFFGHRARVGQGSRRGPFRRIGDRQATGPHGQLRLQLPRQALEHGGSGPSAHAAVELRQRVDLRQGRSANTVWHFAGAGGIGRCRARPARGRTDAAAVQPRSRRHDVPRGRFGLGQSLGGHAVLIATGLAAAGSTRFRSSTGWAAATPSRRD